MPFIAPVSGIFKGRHQAVAFPNNTPPAMIEMQVRQQDIRDIIPVKPVFCQRLIQGVVPMQVIMTEKPGILLVSDAIVYEDEAVSFLAQQAPHCPRTESILILWNGPS